MHIAKEMVVTIGLESWVMANMNQGPKVETANLPCPSEIGVLECFRWFIWRLFP